MSYPMDEARQISIEAAALGATTAEESVHGTQGGSGQAQREVSALLEEMLELLEQERAALVRLDRDAIERFALRKLEIDAQLRVVASGDVGAAHLDLLKRVRQRAFDNQLLLVNARACVKGVLTLLSPEAAPAYQSGSQAPKPPPVAVNFKG